MSTRLHSPLLKARTRPSSERLDRATLRVPGIVIGMGLGGFVDGIVFHMLLQWHHVVCRNCGSSAQTVEDLRRETFSDGVFHAFTLGLVVAGLFMLWRACGRATALPPARFLSGLLLIGWGVFNLVEGVIDHHVLGLHHVRPGPGQLAWDLAFLASGAALVAAGAGLAHSVRVDPPQPS